MHGRAPARGCRALWGRRVGLRRMPRLPRGARARATAGRRRGAVRPRLTHRPGIVARSPDRVLRSAPMPRRFAPLLVGLLLALGGALAGCAREKPPLTLVFTPSRD